MIKLYFHCSLNLCIRLIKKGGYRNLKALATVSTDNNNNDYKTNYIKTIHPHLSTSLLVFLVLYKATGEKRQVNLDLQKFSGRLRLLIRGKDKFRNKSTPYFKNKQSVTSIVE